MACTMQVVRGFLSFLSLMACMLTTCGSRSKSRTRSPMYTSGLRSTQITLILYPKSISSAVTNVKVISHEETVQQHHLVMCDFTWKLRNQATADWFKEVFKRKVVTASAAPARANQVESSWRVLRGGGVLHNQNTPVEFWNLVMEWLHQWSLQQPAEAGSGWHRQGDGDKDHVQRGEAPSKKLSALPSLRQRRSLPMWSLTAMFMHLPDH